MSAAVAAPARPGHSVRVHVVGGPGGRPPEGLTRMLAEAGGGLAEASEPAPDTVVVAVAATVEEALAACPGPGHRLLAICDTVTPEGLRLAIRAGVLAILRSADLTPAQLVAAVHCAHQGDGRMPYAALVRLLGSAGSPAVPRTTALPEAPLLTARQTAVLTLMAEGHGNAVIARTLSCSEHTVKNVIYELMGRLQARNRAHAVACAVRHSII
ncbi:LuxR C-terminal-related transcriptional regulator [Streptomyces sp. NPDC051211]|uniref:helix-turn-helix transcriptional regulator n=1 Tax=Streptomyces sp. NPDC051211 TaxID=3154643 RepID=UPI0034506BDE